MSYKIVDEHHTIMEGIEDLQEAIEYAKEYDADVFCELTGDCVWINPFATWPYWR